MLKKLFSHSLIYGLAPQIPKVATFFVLPVITPFLTGIDFGVYGIITAGIGAVSVFSSLGLNIILSNSFYKSHCQYKWAWRQIYGFLIIFNFFYAVALSFFIYFLIPQEAQGNAWIIIAANVIPIIFFGPTSLIGTLYFQLNQKPMQVAIRGVFSGLVSVVLSVYLIAELKMGYLGWFIASGVAQMILQISFWYPMNIKYNFKPIFNFKRKSIRNYLKISLPTVPHFYGGYLINTSDRLLMRFLNVPTSEIGFYNTANTVGNLAYTAGIASGQAISPMLLQMYKNKEFAKAKYLIFILQCVFLISTSIVCLWMKEIFHLLIRNEELVTIYPLAIILVMSYNYRPMYFGANYSLFYYEKTKSLLRITVIAGISNVLLNIILIPIIGYEVAAYTTFVCLMYIGFVGFYLKEFKQFNNQDYHPLTWLLVMITLTVLCYFAVELSTPTKIIISLVVFLSGIFTLFRFNQYFTVHDNYTDN